MAFFSTLWAGVKWLGGTLLPMFSKSPSNAFANFLRWIIHFVLIAAILFGLWHVNWYFDLERVLRSPWPMLHKVWLPLLFLMLYLLAWLSYGLWSLLGPEGPTTSYPDIDSAWNEALRALSQASIRPSDAPLYLVLGRPAGGEDSLFNAARLQLAVQQTPRNAEAPVHVYANRDAVFVTCNHACLLSEQARLFAEHATTSRRAFLPVQSSVSAPNGTANPMPAAAAASTASVNTKAEAGPGADAGGAPVATATRRNGSEVSPGATAAAPARTASARPMLRSKPAMQLAQARLNYLCRLIAQERRPYCAVNGILLLLPLAALEGDAEASQVASLAQADVQTARSALQVECPIFVVVCDLEQAPGFAQFLEQIPEPERLQPLGQSFPLLPDVDTHELPQVLEGGMEALCQRALPNSIYHLFRLESAPEHPARMNGTLTANARLYQFLTYLRQGRKRLGRLVYRGAYSETSGAPMVAGCYFAATGVDARHEQAFVAGLFQQVVENQNYVSWTSEALRREGSYRRTAGAGYFLLLLLIAGAAAAIYWLTRPQ